MIYLTKLTLNPLNRQVQSELAFPYEMHRTLQKAFGTARQEANVLYRVEENDHTIHLLVQATEPPDWTHLIQGRSNYLAELPAIQSFHLLDDNDNLLLTEGKRFRFRLRANPSCKKIRYGDDGERRSSNRVPHLTPESQLAWLEDQGERNGFQLIGADITATGRHHDNRHNLTIHVVQFDGLLQLTNPDTFYKNAYQQGLGPAKAFGCGLLSLANV